MQTKSKWTIEDVKKLAEHASDTFDRITAIVESFDETIGNLCVQAGCDYTVEDAEEGGDADEAHDDLSILACRLDAMLRHLSRADAIAKKLGREGYGC